MGIQDLIITPFYIILLTVFAYFVRPYVTNAKTRKYFLPALWARFLGAIAVGMIYQFYYGGGDTFTYFHLGSKYIHQAFLEDPYTGLSLIFGKMEITLTNFQYASQIFSFGDRASYAVVRFAGFFDIFTFHTYSATAIFFATLSFSGVWMIYTVFERQFPSYRSQLAITILFFPSLFFWGSGLLKDTITIAAVGWLFFGIIRLTRGGTLSLLSWILILVAAYILYVIKIYILLSIVPALVFWLLIRNQAKIRNRLVRIAVAPLLIVLGVGAAALVGLQLGQIQGRYSIDKVLITAEETAKWNYYVSNRDRGSGYTLGDYDFSPSGLARKFFPAVGTTFFRPFIWEVRNPVMLLAALENAVILFFFALALVRLQNLTSLLKEPLLIFCVVFTVLFSFAIGVTTYNFGSLVRYKIPMLVFLAPTVFLLSRRNLKVPQ